MNELTQVSEARRALAQAKTLPDLKRVMEAATVAADALRRQSRLMEAEGMSEMVREANEAANEAASVRIEAQAQAGLILTEMAVRGERQPRTGGGGSRSNQPSLQELGVPHAQASMRWRRVSEIPPEVRESYVAMANDEGLEATSAGLLRYASDDSREEPEQFQVMSREIRKACKTLTDYDPQIVAGMYTNARRRGELRQLAEGLSHWLHLLTPHL